MFLLWALEERREKQLADARHYLALGKQSLDGDDATAVPRLERLRACRNAVAAAETAARLRDGPDARELIAMARLLGRDFAAAYRAYRAVRSISGDIESSIDTSGSSIHR
jgi:hypothetical protein